MKKIITIVLCVLLLMSAFGCKAYVEQKVEFKHTVGTWNLDCIYRDTKSVTFIPTVLTIDKGKSATIAKEEKITKYDIEVVGDGEMIFKSKDAEGTDVTYQFTVDAPAQLMHLYANINDMLYHYVYVEDGVDDENVLNRNENKIKDDSSEDDKAKDEADKDKNKDDSSKDDTNEKDE